MSNTGTAKTVDYLMTLNDQGVLVHTDSDVIKNDLTVWLDTPRGSVFGNPSWGNELSKFKHEVMNEDLAVSVENSLARGLVRDLPLISALSSISVAPNNFDQYQIVITTPYGIISRLL